MMENFSSKLRIPFRAIVIAMACAFASVGGNAADAPSTAKFSISNPPKILPSISFETSDGMPTTLDRFKGKFVLLNIWATWCAPCRYEMPTLDRLQAKLGSEKFVVVALSIDRAGQKPVRKFFSETDVKNLEIYIDRSMQAMRSLSAVVLPTTLLIGPEGREIGRLLGPAEWDSPEMIRFLKSQIDMP